MQLRALIDLSQQAFLSWKKDYAPSMGAALAYYTVFSVAPLLLIVISVAGLVFGQEAARGEIFAQLSGLMGAQGALAVQGMLEAVNKPRAASWPNTRPATEITISSSGATEKTV
jgi:membrane protein